MVERFSCNPNKEKKYYVKTKERVWVFGYDSYSSISVSIFFNKFSYKLCITL